MSPKRFGTAETTRLSCLDDALGAERADLNGVNVLPLATLERAAA
jgi:hypothetical protein